MADPLSITSGIAGLLSLGIKVTQSLISFYSTYKDQDNDLAKIARNLEDLQNIFESLETAVQDRQSQDNAELLKVVNKAIQGCQEIIKELQQERQKFSIGPVANLTGRIRVAGRHAAYPFRKSTLLKLAEDISAIRENLSLALDVLQLKSHSQTQYDLSEVKSLLERINKSQLSSTIHNWLMAPDVSIDHNTACAKRHSSTGLWFINSDQFRNWLVGHNSFLWINGFAGCGKSVLCSTAIQHTFHEMKDKHGIGIAFFYFSFNDEAKQNSHGMLCALLLQLSVQLQNGEKDLEQLYKSHKFGTPPVDALLDSLRSVLCQFHEAFILLDALDESPRDCEREDVLRIIGAIRKWNLPGLHLLVTSRNHFDIHQSLDPSHGQVLSMKNPEIDRDIANFVSDQLKYDTKLQRWKTRHIRIQEQLTKNAQGVYVECQLKELRKARNQNQLDISLRTLPQDLDKTYEQILSSIDKTYIDDVRRVLTLLCFSTRPLTVNELIEAHAVDLNVPPHLDREGRGYEQNDLIDICLGLIEISRTDESVPPKSGQSILTARIAHFSVQEYLQSERILQTKVKIFAIQSGPANTEIAQICLVYLLEPILSNGIFDARKMKEFPLAHFAAQYWYHHYINSQEGKSKIEELLQRLFLHDTNYFNTWIRLYDMDGPKIMKKNSYGSPLYYISLLGLESTLSSMIAADAEYGHLLEIVNNQGGYYGNALHAASFKGFDKVVQMLLDHGADVNAQGEYYGSALQAASFKGFDKVVQMLLDHGADVNAQGGRFGSALHAASSSGHEKVVQMLLDHGADVNAQGGYYGSALYTASSSGHEKVVQMLLDHGADINSQGGRYGNALQAASSRGHEKVVQMLLDHGVKGGIRALFPATGTGL
ncbi:hypothetical protein MPDQ_000932 [Monascus purpureus]|uniref:NACHT domain-containing protein n=1 Tax=Monascus purpureus TaxID=5098 RepID=A0A507QSZ3_MONPU|nr:hypothetical protein MPDQ_000932 [Monascus purpureus]